MIMQDAIEGYELEYKYKHKKGIKSNMWSIAARSNKKPKIVTVRTLAGKVNQYIGDVK